MSSLLIFEERDGVAILTLNRSESLNAISQALAEMLVQHLRTIAPRKDIRVVVINGSGERAFSVGTDLKERREMTAAQRWQQSEPLRRACDLIWNLPQPVIAAVHGWCLGGGFEVAINCDYRVADDTAVFAWPEMQLGAFPGGSAGIIFPRLVGRSFAKQMFFTARRIGADEALQRGVVDQRVGKGEALAAALEIAEIMKRNSSPLGAAGAKRMVNHATEMSLAEASMFNELLRAPLEGTKDYEEGIRAFFEKRAPVWCGE